MFLKGTRNYLKYLINEVCKVPNNLNIAKLAVALGEHNYYYYKEGALELRHSKEN